MPSKRLKRCPWPGDDPLMIAYHDKEWGVPLYEDGKLFEFFVLESAQAGLSWKTVLHKRENFRKAFDLFDPLKVAAYDEEKIVELLSDKGIIRNRRKIEAAVNNARKFTEIQEEFGSFASYSWQFVNERPVINRFKKSSEIPATSKESDLWSRDLKSRGFKFVGSTICYAHMQATGMINDHLTGCFRHKEVQQGGARLPLSD